MAVKVVRTSKSGKTVFVNVEIFRLRERGCPVEKLEPSDFVMDVSWEPKGKRFAMVHGKNEDVPRPDVSFFKVTKKQVKLVKTLEKKAVNLLVWSPNGSFVVMAGLKRLNGQLEFFNVNEMETMASQVRRPVPLVPPMCVCVCVCVCIVFLYHSPPVLGLTVFLGPI